MLDHALTRTQSNILIDDQREAIVADFGLAKALNDLDSGGANYTLSNGAQVSMRWMAPELSDALYGTPADVYAWGMTALQVRRLPVLLCSLV